ncbi:MAG: endonuclease/exonuclease/phosphatase family protein [Planctomycetota bacterium]|jgi:endonuclease/exonuclease/phosphatase family metal-dependent hydrolase
MNARLSLIVAVLLGAACTFPASAEELYAAFWNVENLFDTVDDPRTEKDEEFTPRAPKKWTPERFDIKVSNLARVLADMNRGRGPDLLGLSEVENRAVIEALIAKLAPLGRDYGIVHRDSPSFRGIDCAIVYDKSKLELKTTAFHHVDAGNTRDIVEASFEIAGETLHVFANHWPSRRNPPEARIAAARVLRARVDAITEKDAAADILVFGDFNDHPPDVSLTQHLRASTSPAAVRSGAMLNTMGPIHAHPDQGTYVYKNKWGVLDHVIVSPGMLDKKGFRWKRGSTKAIFYEYQAFVHRDRKNIPRPSRTYTGKNFHADGFSDHLPVACILVY